MFSILCVCLLLCSNVCYSWCIDWSAICDCGITSDTHSFYCLSLSMVVHMKGLYSNPSLSRHLLYRGICRSHEFSGTAPPSNCLHPTYWKVVFNFSFPAKNQNVTNFGIHICKLTITMQKSIF